LPVVILFEEATRFVQVIFGTRITDSGDLVITTDVRFHLIFTPPVVVKRRPGELRAHEVAAAFDAVDER
jgi:hypothetical protein